MRIARVLHGSAARPCLALERDGALYDAAELDRIFGTQFSPDRWAGAGDFHTRVIALGGAGLADLDQRLRTGDRPTAARLLPGRFVWLPPCDTDRALYVQMAAYDDASDEPLHRLGDARSLVGHESAVPFPASERTPAFAIGIAAILRDDLRDATLAEAEASILGYTIVNAWFGHDEASQRPPWACARVPAQLGPVLVSADEVGEIARLRAQARVEAGTIASTRAGGWTFSIAESIAYASRWTCLRAGDVIGAGRLIGGSGAVPFGASVELAIERLGKLTGRPVRCAS